MNTLTFFSRFSHENGTEPYVTDGTPEGTRLLADLNPGEASTGSLYFYQLADRVLIYGRNADESVSLWSSDGTTVGTIPLYTGPNWTSTPTLFGDDLAYFVTYDEGNTVPRFVVTDGSPRGTRLLDGFDLAPGFDLYDDLLDLDDLVLFRAVNEDGNTVLMGSDGTQQGTTRLLEIDFGDYEYRGFNRPVMADGQSFFTVFFSDDQYNYYTDLLVSDGTTEGTFALTSGGTFHYVHSLHALDAGVIIVGENEDYDELLWISDGTPDGTRLFEPQGEIFFPHFQAVVDGRALVSAYGINEFSEDTEFLFVTDGTETGTALLVEGFQSIVEDVNGDPIEGGLTFFRAKTPETGGELWVTDGTVNGTLMLADINPGEDQSYPDKFRALGDIWVFTAHGERSNELWRTDGTVEGTFRIAEGRFSSGVLGSYSSIEFGDKLIFQGNRSGTGAEPWVTDGTVEGTFQLVDIKPGSSGSNPANFIRFGDFVVFTAYSDDHGKEYWVTDGTSEGTRLLADIYPGTESSFPTRATVFGDLLLFWATQEETGSELWVTDGTPEGTQLLADLLPGPDNAKIGITSITDTSVLFKTSDEVNGIRLWVTDGTPDGTYPIFDYETGTGNSFPNFSADIGGSLYFSADDGISGFRSWRTEVGGTGASRLELGVLTEDQSISVLADIGERFFFRRYVEGRGTDLWVTDGSEEGTILLTDADQADEIQSPYLVSTIGDAIVFSVDVGANPFYEREAWVSDGTPGGTIPLLETVDGLSFTVRYDASTLRIGDLAVFVAQSADLGEVLLSTDGTSGGTHFLMDLPDMPFGYRLENRGRIGSDETLYFWLINGDGRPSALWQSDGTQQGTVQLQDFESGGNTFGGIVTVLGEGVLYNLDGELFTVGLGDGTISQVTGLEGVGTYAEAIFSGGNIPVNERLIYQSATPDDNRTLWSVGATPGSAIQLLDVVFDNASIVRNLGTLDDVAIITGEDVEGNFIFVATDGTPERSQVLTLDDLDPRYGFENVVTTNGLLFFSAHSEQFGREMWVSDGTTDGTHVLADVQPGKGGSFPDEIVTLGDQVIFHSRSGLFSSDGTVTYQLTDLSVSDFNPIGEVEGSLYFTVSTSFYGTELWVTDGTPDGTRLVEDINQVPVEVTLGSRTSLTFETLAQPGVLQLSMLDGTTGFILNGIDTNDGSGASVASAGDVNGDGIDDLLIAAWAADAGEQENAGEVYVVFGRPQGFGVEFQLASLNGSDGFILEGTDPYDLAGHSVASAGDVNRDGIDDIIIGAYRADPHDLDAAGEAYVVFGSSAGFPARIALSSLDGTNGFVLNGEENFDNAGYAVSSAGDVNNDGFADVLVGAYYAFPGERALAGKTYVVFGTDQGFDASVDLADLDGTNGFVLNGIDTADFSGRAVAGAGDFNGDGIDDLLIGAPAILANHNDHSRAGQSYVVFGTNEGFPPSLELSTLDGVNGFALIGVEPPDYSGASVAAAGDVNGDGFDDIIIGALNATVDGEAKAGESYVIFGTDQPVAASFNLASLNGSNGFILTGLNTEDRSGSSVSSAGDINGDGLDDLLIGAWNADPDGRISAGEAYVVYGAVHGFGPRFDLEILNGTNGFVLRGIDAGDHAGWSVAAAGDLNGDGFDDIVVGAESADPNGREDAGETYVIYGSAAPQPVQYGALTLRANMDAYFDPLTDYIVITPDSPDMAGAVMAEERVDLTRDFVFAFELVLGAQDASGGGGIAFVLHNSPEGSSAAGPRGAGASFASATIENGIGIEFDTVNDPGTGDIGEDHFNFFDTDAPATDRTLTVARALANLEDGSPHQVLIQWHAESQTLSVTVDGVITEALTADIATDYLDGSPFAYFGFTGATTGTVSNLQRVRALSAEGDFGTFGDPGADLLIGDARSNLLSGLAGDDRIFGLAGVDDLRGGGGADLLAGGDGADLLDGGEGVDELWAEAGDDTVHGGENGDLLVGGLGNDVLNGDAGEDELWGQEGVDTINGGDDGDLLVGGLGIDTLNGDAGNDELWGQEGVDRLNGGEGDDLLVGGLAGDILDGGKGEDELWGEADDDTLSGGDDDDLLVGGLGDDILNGDGGDDELWGEFGNDTLNGGAGRDLLVGSVGDDTLNGGADRDELYAQDGADVLDGGEGDDYLAAGTGDDVLIGGAGDDVLWGEQGADTFVFTADTFHDWIGDFAPGEDLIDLSAHSDIHNLQELKDAGTEGEGYTLFDLGDGNYMTLNGILETDLLEADFIFS